jgi:hypothetical protein
MVEMVAVVEAVVVKIQPRIHRTGPATPGQSGMYPGASMKKIRPVSAKARTPKLPRTVSDIQC